MGEFVFYLGLGLFIWQLIRYLKMGSDAEYFAKHPRPPFPPKDTPQ